LGLSEARTQASLVGVATDNGNGTYTYSYTVDNSAGAFPVVAFTLDFPFASSAIDWNQSTGVVTPAGWVGFPGIPTTGLSAQDFLSTSPAADVAVGSTLGGFSFTTAHPPVTIPYITFGASGQTQAGTIVGAGPTAVPEPGTALAALLLISIVAARPLRRTTRPALSTQPLSHA
jgi:hypothetical protein